MGNTCATCACWARARADDSEGFCHRYPPTWSWPETDQSEWCAEWRGRETRSQDGDLVVGWGADGEVVLSVDGGDRAVLDRFDAGRLHAQLRRHLAGEND